MGLNVIYYYYANSIGREFNWIPKDYPKMRTVGYNGLMIIGTPTHGSIRGDRRPSGPWRRQVHGLCRSSPYWRGETRAGVFMPLIVTYEVREMQQGGGGSQAGG